MEETILLHWWASATQGPGTVSCKPGSSHHSLPALEVWRTLLKPAGGAVGSISILHSSPRIHLCASSVVCTCSPLPPFLLSLHCYWSHVAFSPTFPSLLLLQ